MPELEENNYLGRKLTHYQEHNLDPKSGLYPFRKYDPKIKFDNKIPRYYDKLRYVKGVKYVNKPIKDIFRKKTRHYKDLKEYDYFFEYDPAADEREEQEKFEERMRQIRMRRMAPKDDEDEYDYPLFPDGLWKSTVGTFQRTMTMFSRGNAVTPSPTNSPMQSQLLKSQFLGSPMQSQFLRSPMQSQYLRSPMQSQFLTPSAVTPIRGLSASTSLEIPNMRIEGATPLPSSPDGEF